MKKHGTIAALAVLLAAGCGTPKLPDPHNHVVDVHAAPWRIEYAPEARLVWVDVPPADRLRGVVTNESRTARAYVLTRPWTGDTLREHLQIEDLTTKRVYELEGLPFEWRDYDDLAWMNDRYLAFDRWTHPHYGRHFVVDFKRRRLVLMAPFPDAFYLEQGRNNTKPTTVNGWKPVTP